MKKVDWRGAQSGGRNILHLDSTAEGHKEFAMNFSDGTESRPTFGSFEGAKVSSHFRNAVWGVWSIVLLVLLECIYMPIYKNIQMNEHKRNLLDTCYEHSYLTNYHNNNFFLLLQPSQYSLHQNHSAESVSLRSISLPSSTMTIYSMLSGECDESLEKATLRFVFLLCFLSN